MGDLDKLTLDLETMAREHELYENPLTEKQRDILSAAERLFSEAGYSDTSTASIAKQAGVTERTLFKHFPTKQDLLRRILFPLLLKTIVPIQIKIVRKVIQAEHKTYREFFVALALDRWTTARQLGPKLKLVLSELLRNDTLKTQLFKLARENVWPELVKNIERYKQSGEIRSDLKAEDVARVQVSLIVSHALLRAVLAPQKEFNDQNDANILVDIMLNGVSTKKT